MILHGRVFNVTEFLSEHPGGPEIMLNQAGTRGPCILFLWRHLFKVAYFGLCSARPLPSSNDPYMQYRFSIRVSCDC